MQQIELNTNHEINKIFSITHTALVHYQYQQYRGPSLTIQSIRINTSSKIATIKPGNKSLIEIYHNFYSCRILIPSIHFLSTRF